MKKVWIAVIIGLIVCLVAYAQAPPDPNSVTDPNKIKMPEGVNMPVALKCPVHGIIGKAYIVIEANGQNKVYCVQCVKSLVSAIFDENLPTLEVVK